ncbi:class I SAM-dependent methyltransferase [Methanolacinia paynteri]|uniref:class I SAM-dependent methyltransferase n=1 Tax=Methanolacinia paynteri TaxID=230356 RepID=UPI00064E2DFB|nr:class I SAM-dependent methyltransferase [Methanolacinia paynteri]
MEKAEEHFNNTAQNYENDIEKIVTDHESFFNQAVSLVPDGGIDILELGSGTGYLTEKIIEKNPGASVTCIDMTPEMIDVAMAKKNLEVVEFILGDFREKWPDKKFDLTISTLCFHHLPDIDREYIIGKVRDSLKDNGIFVNGDVFKAGDTLMDEILNDRWEKAMIKNGLSAERASGMINKRKAAAKFIDTPEGYREKLLNAGFERVFCFYSYDIYGVFAAFK